MDDRDRTRDIERLAYLLDDVVTIPGTRIRVGLDAVLGLLPGGGDLIGGALSAWIIVAAVRLGAPPAVVARMGANVLLDTLVGTVPAQHMYGFESTVFLALQNGGAFWAGRSYLQGRKPEVFNYWALQAANYPHTFYGLLALGHLSV